MIIKLEILKEAEVDILEGFNFYELQQSGLGKYFIDSIFSDIDFIKISAGAHPVENGHHKILSKRFPFAIYYTLNKSKKTVKVNAVIDCRRNPAWIRKKLKK
jgi:hypothetical protein